MGNTSKIVYTTRCLFATFLTQSRSPTHFLRYRDDFLAFHSFHFFCLGMHRIGTREHHPHRVSRCPDKPRSSFGDRCPLRPSQSALVFPACRFRGGWYSHSSSRDMGNTRLNALPFSSHRTPPNISRWHSTHCTRRPGNVSFIAGSEDGLAPSKPFSKHQWNQNALRINH